jgi:hypothetical protein
LNLGRLLLLTSKNDRQTSMHSPVWRRSETRQAALEEASREVGKADSGCCSERSEIRIRCGFQRRAPFTDPKESEVIAQIYSTTLRPSSPPSEWFASPRRTMGSAPIAHGPKPTDKWPGARDPGHRARCASQMGSISAGNVDCGRGKPGAPNKQLNRRRISEVIDLSTPNAPPITEEGDQKEEGTQLCSVCQ